MFCLYMYFLENNLSLHVVVVEHKITFTNHDSSSCRMQINCWRKEYDLGFPIESCCSYHLQWKIHRSRWIVISLDWDMLKTMLNAMIDLPCRLLMHILKLPIDSSFPHDYATEFNTKVQVSFFYCECFPMLLLVD